MTVEISVSAILHRMKSELRIVLQLISKALRITRLQDLPRTAPGQAAFHQSAGTPEQGSEAPRRCRRHLPQRRQHHPPRRCRPARAKRRIPAPAPLHADRGHGSARNANHRGGSAATDYTQGRLKMPPAGHNRIYTTLTDTTPDCAPAISCTLSVPGKMDAITSFARERR